MPNDQDASADGIIQTRDQEGEHWLPSLDWQASQGIWVHYATAEIVEVNEDEKQLVLKAAQEEFIAQLSLSGYSCDLAAQPASSGRITLHGKDGKLVLRKIKEK